MIITYGFLAVFTLDHMICLPMMFLSKKHHFQWMLAYYLVIILYCLVCIISALVYAFCQ